jgi:hypothetical protein
LVGFKVGKGPNHLSDEVTLAAQLIKSLEKTTDKLGLVLFGPNKRRKLKFDRSEVLTSRREFCTMCRPSRVSVPYSVIIIGLLNSDRKCCAPLRTLLTTTSSFPTSTDHPEK